MVTEAGKELLRNTINTAKFHNKLLEENEMWKQWEIERGLTMMVSDDDILKKIRKNHKCDKHRRRGDSEERRSNDSLNAVPGTSKDVSDRWDHSGFLELYPDGKDSDERKSVSSKSKDLHKKWDHSGFLELYPEEKVAEERDAKERHKKHKKKKKRKHVDSSSDNEIYEEFKKYKRSRSKKTKAEAGSSSSGFDSHVKDWKKHKDKFT